MYGFLGKIMETNTESTTTSAATSAIDNDNKLTLLYENLLNFNGTEIKEQLYLDSSVNSVKLFKNGIDLTANINNAFSAYIYDKEHWAYRDNEGFVHLYNESKYLNPNIKTKGILQHPRTGQWLYADAQNDLNLLPII